MLSIWAKMVILPAKFLFVKSLQKNELWPTVVSRKSTHLEEIPMVDRTAAHSFIFNLERARTSKGHAMVKSMMIAIMAEKNMPKPAKLPVFVAICESGTMHG